MSRNSSGRRTFFASLANAFEGLSYALKSQRNLQIHLAAGVVAVVAAVAMELSRVEVVLVVLTVCLVVLGEMLNTALEFALNLLEARHHPVVRAAKDLAAGGVLTAVAGSIVVGFLLFGPRLWALLWGLRG